MHQLAEFFATAPAGDWWTERETAEWLNLPVGTISSGRHYKTNWLAECSVAFGKRTRRYHGPTIKARLASMLGHAEGVEAVDLVAAIAARGAGAQK